MRAPALKSLLTYLALVGLPLAGLLGILHAGRDLQAPPAIGGAWRTLSLATLHGTLLTPGPVPPGGQLPALEVRQSGAYLTLVIGGQIRFSGRLRGDSLVARSAGPVPLAYDGACGREQGVELRAALDRAAAPHRMAGVLAVEGRPECPRVYFTAERETAPMRARGRRQ